MLQGDNVCMCCWHPLTGRCNPAPCHRPGTQNEDLHVLLAIVHRCAAWQVYSLDVDSFKWSEHTPDVSGDPPSPRDCHSAVALPDGRHILVFGGGDSDAEVFFSSVALLDTQTWRWSSPKLQVRRRDTWQAQAAGVVILKAHCWGHKQAQAAEV